MDDDLEDFLAQYMPEPEVGPPPPEDAFQRLKRTWPRLPEDALRWFASETTAFHIDAATRQLSKRVRHTLSVFILRYGTPTSDDFVWENGRRMGGNFVFIKELKDEGFLVDSQTLQKQGQSRFFLDLKRFNQAARRRDALSQRRRLIVFAHYGNECQRCGAQDDLEADHRVPVGVGGGKDPNAAFLVTDWQPLCGSCNSTKSNVCERCRLRDPAHCQACYWANPKDHTHKAGEPGYWFDGGKLPEAIPAIARKAGLPPHEWVQTLLQRAVQHVLRRG